MRAKSKSVLKRPQNVCYCNAISKETVEEAIRGGARTLGEIFDQTQAGVGACGGTCRPYLQKMLESFEKTGTFPENPRPPKSSNRSKGDT